MFDIDDYNIGLIALAIATIIVALIIFGTAPFVQSAIKKCQNDGGYALTDHFGTDIKDCKFRGDK